MLEENRYRVEIGIAGMDCVECTRHVQRALAAVPGVTDVDVYLASEKAVLCLAQPSVDMDSVRNAVEEAGYQIAEKQASRSLDNAQPDLAKQIGRLTAALFALILLTVIFGEWLGLFDVLMEHIPWFVGLFATVAAGYPIFRNVFRALRHRQVTAHALMTVGVIAALLSGQWITALLVVFFMRVGDYIEHFTAEQTRRAVGDLSEMAPQTARVLREGKELEMPINQVSIGEIVIVRPGEKIPVDGEVLTGHATIDQSAITGEAMPVEVGPGSTVFAATIASLGALRVQVNQVGSETTFGRIIQLVEEAEANRGEYQRFADKFTVYYLPMVATIALLTLIFRRDPSAMVAVLVVACSCSIALATPIAMLASIGSAAKKGLMIKGGKYLEALDQADVLLIDKTGTLTLGRPIVCDVIPLNGIDDSGLLILAASAEKYSEHPVAEAVREAARECGLVLHEPTRFEALPGLGVRAEVAGTNVMIGNRRLVQFEGGYEIDHLEAQGKTILFVVEGDTLCGVLAVKDTLRPQVPDALASVQKMGIEHIELLTGDNERVAAAIASQLSLPYRAEMLPEDKIAIVKEYQRQGHRVVMIGDGVNDAPALAQADVGVAMGAIGSDIALEAAHIALMRDDWTLVPELFNLAHRTMRVVKFNLGFTGIYNVIGLTLAAFGILPPVLAAAAQSLPDLGILANSSRLLRG